MLDRILAQVPEDEKVGVKAHIVDHGQLIVKAPPQLLVGFGIPSAEPLFGQLSQISLWGMPVGYRKDGQVVFVTLDFYLAARRDAHGVL